MGSLPSSSQSGVMMSVMNRSVILTPKTRPGSSLRIITTVASFSVTNAHRLMDPSFEKFGTWHYLMAD